MALALAFLPQAIAPPVALAFSQVRWVQQLQLPVHSVGQEHTLQCAWKTAAASQARQRVIHDNPPIVEVSPPQMC